MLLSAILFEIHFCFVNDGIQPPGGLHGFAFVTQVHLNFQKRPSCATYYYSDEWVSLACALTHHKFDAWSAVLNDFGWPKFLSSVWLLFCCEYSSAFVKAQPLGLLCSLLKDLWDLKKNFLQSSLWLLSLLPSINSWVHTTVENFSLCLFCHCTCYGGLDAIYYLTHCQHLHLCDFLFVFLLTKSGRCMYLETRSHSGLKHPLHDVKSWGGCLLLPNKRCIISLFIISLSSLYP